MAKAKDFDRLGAYIRGQTIQPGMFSTLDELIQAAPKDKMTSQEWKEYLQTGRMLEREGTQFPLKKAELEHTQFDETLQRLAKETGAEGIESMALRDAVATDRPVFERTQGLEGPEGRWFSKTKSNVFPHFGRQEKTGPRFQEYELHHTSPDSGYEESVTRLRDLEAGTNSHFGKDAISWSRATKHALPEGKKLRLIEEIQSDIHQGARKRESEGNPGYLRNDEARQLEMLRRDIASYVEPDQRTPRPDLRSDELAVLKRDLENIDQLEHKAKTPPFSDPKEYARVELSKQLIDAVEGGDDFLGLVRGQDQIDRYETGMDERHSGGMRHMYDNIYPSVLKKLAKRYGARIVDVESPLQSVTDIRGHAMADFGAENWDDMSQMTMNALGEYDIVNWEETPQIYNQVLSEWEDKLKTAGLPHEAHLNKAKSAITRLKKDIEDVLFAEGSYRDIQESFQQQRMKTALEDYDSNLASSLQIVDMAMDDVEQLVKQAVGDSTTNKKIFPAIEITPEVREKIMKVGVPLFSATGALILPEEDEEPRQYAKGGKVIDLEETLAKLREAKGPTPEQKEARDWFKKKFEAFNRRKDAELAATNFLYEPGDVVRGAKFRHEILYKSVDRKTGKPRYHVRNLETGDEYTLPEEGIIGKFDGPKKEFAEGGSVEEDDNKPMSLLRAAALSIANQVPFLSDQTRESFAKGVSYLPAGFKTQAYGINPETQDLEFAMYNPAHFIPLEEREASERLQGIYDREMDRTRAIPGVVDETVALPAMFANPMGEESLAPDISRVARERLYDTEAAVLEEEGLPDPEGFFENLMYSGGIMAGQLPVPSSMFNKVKPAAEAGMGALRKAGRFLENIPSSAVEWLSPIIDPKVGNYLAGSLFGGSMMTGFEALEGDVPPDIEALVERAKAGDEEALAQVMELYEQYQRQLAEQEEAGMAKGGKVTLQELNRRRAPRLELEEEEIYERLRALERALEAQGLDRQEIRRVLTPRDSLAKGGKVNRRDFLKGLGAAGVALGGAGRAGLHGVEGRLKGLEEGLPAVKAATKAGAHSAAPFRSVSNYLRGMANDFLQDADTQKNQHNYSGGDYDADMEEVTMIRDDADKFESMAQLMDEGKFEEASELYDSMDTAARDWIHALEEAPDVPPEHFTQARAFLEDHGVEFFDRPPRVSSMLRDPTEHPQWSKIQQELEDLDEKLQAPRMRSTEVKQIRDRWGGLRKQLEDEGYDIDFEDFDFPLGDE